MSLARPDRARACAGPRSRPQPNSDPPPMWRPRRARRRPRCPAHGSPRSTRRSARRAATHQSLSYPPRPHSYPNPNRFLIHPNRFPVGREPGAPGAGCVCARGRCERRGDGRSLGGRGSGMRGAQPLFPPLPFLRRVHSSAQTPPLYGQRNSKEGATEREGRREGGGRGEGRGGREAECPVVNSQHFPHAPAAGSQLLASEQAAARALLDFATA